MDKEFYNKEGYADPTPYHAIYKGTGHSFRPVVCTINYSVGDEYKDEMALDAFCRMAIDRGCIPFSPKYCFYYMNQPGAMYEYFSLIMLTKCRELWVLGKGTDSDVRSLIKAARNRGIEVRFYREEDIEDYRE